MAATVKYQSNSGPIGLRAYPSLYNKLFDEVKLVSDKVPQELKRFFKERDWNQETYREGEVTNVLEVPVVSSDTDSVHIIQPAEGYYKDFTNTQRRSAIQVTKRAVNAQKTSMIEQMITGLPESAVSLEQLGHAKLFDDGFATETTGDGSYVFATDHYYADPQFGQWSNLAASPGTVTSSSFFTGWLNLQNRKNDKGFPCFQVPGEVVYPAELHEDVMKLHGSTLYPQNALNAKLPALFGAFEPVMAHWPTSTTAWYMHAKVTGNKLGFRWIWETRPEYASISDSMNSRLIMGKDLTMAFSYGALHSRDWYGNAGV